MNKFLFVVFFGFIVVSELVSFLRVRDVVETNLFLPFVPEGGPRSAYYDTSLESALKQISNSLHNETIIVSSRAPEFTFFTGLYSIIPYGINGQDSLVSFMKKTNASYLLVFENQTDVEELQFLFNSSGIKNLENNFQELATQSSDFSKIHLYRLKISNQSVSV